MGRFSPAPWPKVKTCQRRPPRFPCLVSSQQGFLLKDGPHLFTGGGEMHVFFFTQNAKSQDWSVVWSSNLFWHTLWTLPALFGSLTPPKSICTQRHSLQKFLSKKMHILGPAGPTSAFLVQKIFGSQIRSEAVKHLRMAPETDL